MTAESMEGMMNRKQLVDKRTGREVLTSHPPFKWKEGQVLRAVPQDEALDSEGKVINENLAYIGGDFFEWIPADQVEIEEK